MTNVRSIPIADRSATRLARIKGDKVPVLQVESAVAPETVEPVKATARQGGLGPNQLAWCREKLGVFATCERQAIEAENHRQQMMEAVRS